MRWLAVQPGPSFSVHDCYTGWTEALRDVGQQVARFNLDERLTFYDTALMPTAKDGFFRKAVGSAVAIEMAVDGLCGALYKLRPDVLFVFSGFFVPSELMDLARAYGTRVVVLHTESPYEDDRQVPLAAHADLNLVTDRVNLDRFAAVAPSVFMPHAYRPTVHRPGPPLPDLICDFAFVGTGYPSRVAYLEAMDLSGLDVLLAGNWQAVDPDSPLRPHLAHQPAECLDNARAADVYRSARVGLNLYRREHSDGEHATGWSMGPRDVEMAACGLFFLRDAHRRGEADEVLSMLPAVADPAEAGEALRWWLAHPDERAEAALKARSAVADRTFDHHAAELLRLLEEGVTCE